MRFKYKDNGFSRVLVLLPGWGFDYRIFENVGLEYNFVYYKTIDIQKDVREFSSFIRSSAKGQKITFLAWSMGAFILNEMLRREKFNVDKIFLVSAPMRFETVRIDHITDGLQTDFQNEMLKFYRKVFMGDRRLYASFTAQLQDKYLKFSKTRLLREMKFLRQTQLTPENFNSYALHFVYAQKDILVPEADALHAYSKIKGTEHSLSRVRSTHTPFLYREIIDELNKR